MKIFKKCTVKDPGLDPETDFNAPETENLMDIFRGYMVIIFFVPTKYTRYTACKDGLNKKSFMSNFVPILCCMYVKSYCVFY